YVPGESLRRILARGKLGASYVADLATQICAGIDEIHDAGIAHGDLKPDNVLVDGSGVAKVTDFGVARISAPAEPGKLAGTLEYMSPEQLEGAPADPASDIYALGVMLCELYTAQRPWGAVARDDMI